MNKMPELKRKYIEEIRPKLLKEKDYKNIMAVPQVLKVTVNAGLGEAKNDSSLIDQMVEEMEQISGQKPVVTKAKKSISNFKIRPGMPIGVMVTLRQNMMWYFVEKLVNIVLPRVKDFRGLNPKAFDGKGNFTMGLKEHIVFPEIDTNKVVKIKPLQIIVNTSADTDEEALELLKLLGFPFRK
jgi:large subunit ribosomal protein L5